MKTAHSSHSWRQGSPRAVAILAGLFAVAGYVAPLHAATTDPNVDFGAHLEHRGLVIDQARNGQPAVLVPAGSLFSSGPNFLLQSGGKTLAGLWMEDSAHAIIRRSADPSSPLIGRIHATWPQDAIQLTLTPADGPALQLGRFHRVDSPRDDILGVGASTVLDLRGMYVAQLRDPQGAKTGWLRVRISPYQDARRIFEGNLPATLPEPLAAAAVALVNSDISYLRSRAVDVYQGN
jgi:hypothetical protein